MSFDLEKLRVLVAEHGTVARVVVADVQGSTPREVGAAMWVWQGGQEGTIGGGALEWEAVKRARLLKSQTSRVDRVSLGPAIGQCCGGAVTLVSEVFDAISLSKLETEVFFRRIEGNASVPLKLERVLAAQRNSGAHIEPAFSNGWLIEPINETKRDLWIYGAGHVGRALVSIFADLPSFSVTWIDTNDARFPQHVPANVEKLVAAIPADTVRFAPSDAHHLILTYSHAIDLELCHAVLQHSFQSVGLIGSKTKWARFRKRLKQLGHTDAQISRIQCPIGVPALGKHPVAIAVGVASSLLSTEAALSSIQDGTGYERQQ